MVVTTYFKRQQKVAASRFGTGLSTTSTLPKVFGMRALRCYPMAGSVTKTCVNLVWSWFCACKTVSFNSIIYVSILKK